MQVQENIRKEENICTTGKLCTEQILPVSTQASFPSLPSCCVKSATDLSAWFLGQLRGAGDMWHSIETTGSLDFPVSPLNTEPKQCFCFLSALVLPNVDQFPFIFQTIPANYLHRERQIWLHSFVHDEVLQHFQSWINPYKRYFYEYKNCFLSLSSGKSWMVV